MAKFFLKSKNKVFRVRRKKIHWFNTQLEMSQTKITVNKLLLNSIKSKKTYKNKILLHMSNMLDNYLVRMGGFFKNQKTNVNLSNLKSLYLYATYTQFLRKTVIRSSATPEYIEKLNNIGIQGVVFSTPSKQMYTTIINKTPKLVFSAGLMRLAMNLEAKCSKKSKIVVVNSLKFLCLMIAKLLEENYYFLKFIRNIVYLQTIFLQLDKSELNKKISYVLFEPKIQFDTLNRYKRSSLKKNLRKRKKYSEE